MAAGKELTEIDVLRVVKLVECGRSRRDIACETNLGLHAVQECIDRAAVWWLQGWRVRRVADELDRLSDPH